MEVNEYNWMEADKMDAEMLKKYKELGIRIEKTKSRHEAYSNIFQVDPSLLSGEPAGMDSGISDPETQE
ncbi:hypothetical protein [Bacillus massiliglaciei]|uniref:hypothetical protein n=1 Tax=Bacillus massiliglaciei TaxID=1816693 RepID=UPI0018FEDEC5|nr:hypothetical protein [Bacillus massiliglaciei]